MPRNAPPDPGSDRETFKQLYTDRHDRLLNTLAGMVRDRSLAEDLTAAAFQTAWEKRDQFRGESSLATWLYAIGRNGARNSWLHRKRSDDQDPLTRFQAARHSEPDRLSARLEQEELRDQVRQALGRVPPKWRRLLIARYIDGLSIGEIARREHVPVGTIGSRLFAARRTLREAWEDLTPMQEPTREEKLRRIAEDALDRLAAALEAGHSETLRAFLAIQGRFHRYSLNNTLLIAAQRPDATRVAGYHTWHELGRFVKKGEKAIAIYALLLVKKTSPESAGGLPERRGRNGNLVRDETRADAILRVAGFRQVHVFDVSQTDGKPLPEFAATRGDPRDYTEKLKGIVDRQGIALAYDPSIAPAKGITWENRIYLLPGLPAGEEFSVLAHELAHATLHLGHKGERPSETVLETQAEAVSYVVCRGIGLDTNTAASDYIALYRGDKKTLAESLAVIHDASTRILKELLPEERLLPAPEQIAETVSSERSDQTPVPWSQDERISPNAKPVTDRVDITWDR